PEARYRGDERALDGVDERAHTEAEPVEVEQRVDHELTRTVIRHLPAAIYVHDRDIARREHVLRARIHAEREHRRVLEKPELVGRLRTARLDLGLHRAPRGLVRRKAEPAQDR